MNHTPGPWAYHKWGAASGSRFGVETADHCHGLGGIEPNGNASTLLTIQQHEANARLMAAAPELLEALKIAEVHLGWGDCTLENVHQICRDAIAKATERK